MPGPAQNTTVVAQTTLDSHLNDLFGVYDNAMQEGNWVKASRIALLTFAMFKAQSASFNTVQQNKFKKMLEETTNDNVATYNKKWKMIAGVTAGLIQIGAGCMGIGGAVGGGLLGGAAGAIAKGLGGAAQPVSYAGSGLETGSNALFSSTEGERVALNALNQMLQNERDETTKAKDSAQQAKSQAFENEKSIRESRARVMQQAASAA